MGLFFCDALRLKWQMSRVKVNLRAEQKDLRFCYDILRCVSRSFAVVIMKLSDATLRDGICIFYLVLRALDTLEDDMGVPVEVKLRELPKFHVHLSDPTWSMTEVGQGKERELLEQFPRLSSEYRKLPSNFQQVIADVCERMANGMCDFLQRPVVTTSDYDLYCHYVAGLVGHGLTRLFACCAFENPLLAQDLSIANHMGLFLQKTNIIRDYYEDIVEEPPRAFWPREIWGRYVNTLAELRTIALASCSSTDDTDDDNNNNNSTSNSSNNNKSIANSVSIVASLPEEEDAPQAAAQDVTHVVPDTREGESKELETVSTQSMPLSYSDKDEHEKDEDETDAHSRDSASPSVSHPLCVVHNHRDSSADTSYHRAQHASPKQTPLLHNNDYINNNDYVNVNSVAVSAAQEQVEPRDALTRARHCINAMVCDAVQHLPHVIDYLCALQDPSVLTFCAIPQVMAIATLTEVYNNPQTFLVKVKVSRPETCRIMLHCQTLAAALDMMADYCNALYRRLDWHDETSTLRLREALFATTTKIDAYRELRAPVPYTRSLLTRYPALGGQLILTIADSVAGFFGGGGTDPARSTKACEDGGC